MSVDFYAIWGERGAEQFGETVNTSSANGRALLEILGYDTAELAGEDAPDGFLARVRRAMMRAENVSGSDEGEPWTEGTGARGARWVDCGRPSGYFAMRLPELIEVAAEAAEHGGLVCWA